MNSNEKDPNQTRDPLPLKLSKNQRIRSYRDAASILVVDGLVRQRRLISKREASQERESSQSTTDRKR